MTEIELGYPGEGALASTEDEYAAAMGLMQGELIELSLWRLRREMFADPGAWRLNVGAGFPAEQTIPGNQRDPFNGVIFYNPTPATLSVGFQAGTGPLAPATVPPFTACSFPERFTNLSVYLANAVDQQATIANVVTILRTRIPPKAFASPFGAAAPLQPFQSLPAGSAALGAGLALDNGFPRQAHSLIATAAGAPTAGSVALQGSHDGVNWATIATTAAIAATGVFVTYPAAPAAMRYVRAAIATAITGGTVGVTVASS